MARKFSNLSVTWKSGDNRNNNEQFLRKVREGPSNMQGRIGKKNRKFGRQPDRLGWEHDAVMDDNGMGRGSGSAHYTPVGYRRVQRPMITHRAYWFQILIENGSRYQREDVLARITDYLAPRKFFPICYQIIRNDSVFYIERFDAAQMILSCTRKIAIGNGDVLAFRIRDTRPPNSPVDNVMVAKLKTAMARRFVAENNALDLSSFSRDPEFIDGLFCCLVRQPVFAAVMKIIHENIPGLHALNLSSNSFRNVEYLVEDLKKLKSLRILYLNDNLINNLNTMNNMKQMEISELTMHRNPVVKNYPDRAHFISEIRKRFPKLTKLDDTDLMPVVTFDVADDDAPVPVPKAFFVCAPEGRDFVKAFLSQYIQIYDSDNRLDLAQAYADNAMFSLSSTYPLVPATDSPRLNSYITASRNIMRVTDLPRRKSRLHTGKSNIVDFLFKQLPKTQHDLLSFAVDLPIFTPQLISLFVTGVFRETGTGEPSNWPLRYFSRTFLIVPMGSGFCIINETLFVTNVSNAQAESAFKVQPETAAPVPASIPAALSPEQDTFQRRMVQTVSEQTSMNLDWSKKCLEETEWDLSRAVFTFTELQKIGAIPAEAFNK